MLCEAIFTWMAVHRRDPAFLADLCGMSPDRLRDLACGKVVPTDDEVAALATAIGLPESELRSAIGSSPAATVDDHDPLKCFTIREAAVILRVGRDRVDALVETGQLASIALGERTIRISRRAIDELLDRLEQHGRDKGQSSAPQNPRDPPRDPPERHPDDPPTGRPRLL